LYLLFLFLPAARGVDITRAGFETVAIELGAPTDPHDWDQRWLLGAVGLSHLVMFGSPLIMLASRRSTRGAFVLVSLIATILQVYMVWWLHRFGAIEVGSYLSASAFAVLTLGLYFRSRAGLQARQQVSNHAV
jgi:hypothetical protein